MEQRAVPAEHQETAADRRSLPRHLIGVLAGLVLTPIGVWALARSALRLDTAALTQHPEGRTFDGNAAALLLLALLLLGVLVLTVRRSPLGPVVGGVVYGIVPWVAFLVAPQGTADRLVWAGPQQQLELVSYLQVSALPLGVVLVGTGLAALAPARWGASRLARWPRLLGVVGVIVVLGVLLAVGHGLGLVRANLSALAADGPWPGAVTSGLVVLGAGVLVLWAFAALLGRVGTTLWLPGAVLMCLGALSLLDGALYDAAREAGDTAYAAVVSITPCLALALGAALVVAGLAVGTAADRGTSRAEPGPDVL